MAFRSSNRKAAADTNRDGLESFSTTHPPQKEQVDVLYHIDDARRKPQ